MSNIDIHPFGEHDKTDLHSDDTGETIPFTPGGRSTWEPECNQETSFGGGRTQEGRLMLTVCTKNYLSIIAEPWMPSNMITL